MKELKRKKANLSNEMSHSQTDQAGLGFTHKHKMKIIIKDTSQNEHMKHPTNLVKDAYTFTDVQNINSG